jgi:hypothetical protein
MNRKNITKIIKRLVRKWDRRGYSPLSINTGNCDDFANDIVDACKCGQAIWGEDIGRLFKNVDPFGHCFFMYRGYFYDSEMPQGTNNPQNLPYYKRIINFKK